MNQTKLRKCMFKVTMDNLKCNYLATSPAFILQAVRSRRMKQVILEVDKTQLVVCGVQQLHYSKKKQRPRSTIMEKKLAFGQNADCIKKIGLQEMSVAVLLTKL